MTLPTNEDILTFIRESETPLTKREIVRAFNIKGDDRKLLKDQLRKLEQDGHIVKGLGQKYSVPNALPAITTIRIIDTDIDGDLIAAPTTWDEDVLGPTPKIEITDGGSKLKQGDQALARLRKFTDTLYEAKIIRVIDNKRLDVMGQVIKSSRGYRLQPTDKKAKYDFDISESDLNGAKPGDLVMAEITPSRTLKRRKVKITNVLGNRDSVNAISLIALHEAGLREDFLDKVLDETKDLKVPPLQSGKYKREDLRSIPLVTIDGADARDFDDAVFAEALDGGGFHLIVAIADVAHYVRHKSALDNEAYNRGNSTYFPDRVVPMLPEALSNNLCSLMPNVDRACMAFHIWIDQNGQLQKHKIVRGLMRSHARLIYEQVQAAYDGQTDDLTALLLKDVIKPLYDAYAVLDKARQERGALDLDLPERQILIDGKGKMTGVQNRDRMDAHKLIEEFMILANVAAAQALEARRAPCVYRIHDRPSTNKLEDARKFLEAFELSLPKGGIAKPAQINHLLRKANKTEYAQLISTVILRTQSQAVYSPDNIGHFGLALNKYAHFTSPIRRYADLLVHRSLIRAYGLGDDGLSDEEEVSLIERAEHISNTERNSASAERSAVDRFTAAWMQDHIGTQFSGVINGVTRFGLFVTLDENGADGLIPMRSLPSDFYIHDEQQHALIGRRHGRIYRLGARVTVSVEEADGLTGSSIFGLIGNKSADIEGVKFKKAPGQHQNKKRDKKHGKKPPQKASKHRKNGKKNKYRKKS